MSTSLPSSPNPAVSISFSSMVQESIKPNPHPYAIRTTSTGVLSRSNSSGRNLAASRHHYVPLPPSPTKRESKAHRPTRSLTSALSFPSLKSPHPLPVPPELTGNAKRTRAETLPGIPFAPEESIASAELPANPKLWTVSQLSTYLLSALRVPSRSDCSEPLPLAVVQDVATIVRDAKISGRVFLRLNEEDLESMGINQKWRELLINVSRTLRQSAIKGKIWGSDSDSSPPGSTSPTLPSHPFSSALYNSSSSSLDLSADEAESVKSRHRHHGRVRGMVESFERSGSFSSEGSFDGGNPEDRQSLGRWLREGDPVVDDEVISSPSAEKHAPLTCADGICVLSPEEPSVQDLLAGEADENADADRTIWGARAWEELDLAPGVTVKRLPEHYATPSQKPDVQDENRDQEGIATVLAHGGGSNRGSSYGRGRGRDERRVVTAIFTPSVSASDSPRSKQDPALVSERHAAADKEEASQTLPPEEHDVRTREFALESELVETRALLEAFRVRLEGVERELLRLQELEAQRERQDAKHGAVKTCEVSSGTDAAPVSAENGPLPALSTSDLARDNSSLPSQVTSSLPAVAANIVPHDRRRGDKPRGQIDDTEPSTLSDLPQYVFLVGFGVCAVVLQVMVRKFAGRGPSAGWK